MKIEPVILEGEFVRLEPLRGEHLDGLCRAGLVEEIWRWSPDRISNREDMRRYIESALEDQRSGRALPFATVERASGKIVGSTRFGNLDPANRRAEIGWTWINPAHQRTSVNTEAKFLMLSHAFETWRCIRVELKTDALNEKSRRAIFRLGARQEGILRQHMICSDGRLRDTVYFSLLDSEWMEVKENLSRKLGRIR
jgi:RimJ/RimL family protein N-acetyltransferase